MAECGYFVYQIFFIDELVLCATLSVNKSYLFSISKSLLLKTYMVQYN